MVSISTEDKFKVFKDTCKFNFSDEIMQKILRALRSTSTYISDQPSHIPNSITLSRQISGNEAIKVYLYQNILENLTPVWIGNLPEQPAANDMDEAYVHYTTEEQAIISVFRFSVVGRVKVYVSRGIRMELVLSFKFRKGCVERVRVLDEFVLFLMM